MRPWLLLTLIAAALPACSSEVEITDDAGGGGTQTDTCEALRGDAPQPVNIRIENRTATTVLFDNECGAEGLESIKVDDQIVTDWWFAYSCDDLLAAREDSQQCLWLDCFGNPPFELAPGASHEETWSGLFKEDELSPVPDACAPSCYGTSHNCSRRFAAAPGEHVLTVYHQLSTERTARLLEIPFTMPTDTITVEIHP